MLLQKEAVHSFVYDILSLLKRVQKKMREKCSFICFIRVASSERWKRLDNYHVFSQYYALSVHNNKNPST